MVPLPFSLISIYILASYSSKYGQNYWETRSRDIANGWAKDFHHLYFVMGKSKGNTHFLKKKCLQVSRRKHYSVKDSKLSHYLCSSLDNEQSPALYNHPGQNTSSVFRLQVLLTANCEDHYFGMSPTCRCQEAMQHFLHAPALVGTQWFIFMDDDNFVRPLALASLLGARNKFEAETFVGCASQDAGLYYSSQRVEECATLPRFCWAQPAIINRLAMQQMQPSLDAHLLTDLQSIWGNSHDVVLGMLIWLLDLPAIPLHYIMHYCFIEAIDMQSGLFDASTCSGIIFFHKVSNRTPFSSQKNFNEIFLPHLTTNMSSRSKKAQDDNEIHVGIQASERLSQPDLVELAHKKSLPRDRYKATHLNVLQREEESLLNSSYGLNRDFRPFSGEDCGPASRSNLPSGSICSPIRLGPQQKTPLSSKWCCITAECQEDSWFSRNEMLDELPNFRYSEAGLGNDGMLLAD